MICPLLHPFLFFSLANDRGDRARDLRNPAEEARQVQRALTAAEGCGDCKLMLRQYATAGDILNAFQDFCTRIAIFHFGGHADGYQLLLETPADRCGPKERRADAGPEQRLLGHDK